MSTITTQDFDGVTAPSATITGWTVDSGWVTSTTEKITSPNSISLPKTVTTESFLTYNTADGNSGDVVASAKFYIDVTDRGQTLFGHLRGSATPLGTTTTQYLWELIVDADAGDYTLQIYKQVSGTRTAIGPAVTPTSNPTAGWYQFTFTASGTSLTLAMVRLSDSNYLNSSGSFAATIVNAISITDSSISGSGYAGVSALSNHSTRGSAVYVDDFELDTPATPGGNVFFDNAKQNLLNDRINLASGTIKVALVDSGYVPNKATDAFWSDVVAHEITATGYTAGGETLTSCAVTADTTNHRGKFTAGNVVWPMATITAAGAVIYKDTGTDSTSPVLGYIDFGGTKSSDNGDFAIEWAINGIAYF